MHDFPIKDLCRNDDNRLLKVEFYESLKKGNPKFLGHSEFCLKEIVIDGKKTFEVFNKKIISGKMEILKS